MGERTPRLDAKPGAQDGAAPRAAVESLGSEIAGVREELDTLLGELDRRRHEALDVPLQLRRHALGTSLTIVALVATAAGSVWLTLWRRHRRQRPGAQAGRFRHALARMTEHPERVATDSSVVGKIATAAANAAVAVLVKKVLERGVERLMEAGPTTASAPGSERSGTVRAIRSPRS